MPKNNRNYKKGKPHRDYRKFIIVAEGEREDDYFRFFEGKNNRVNITIVERDAGKSAAKFFLERIDNYDYQNGIENEDLVWFVLDIDRWPRKEINSLNHYCDQKENWNISISNPCFEVWLHYHVLTVIPENLNTAKKFKENLNRIIHGGYNRDVYAKLIKTATKNSANSDNNKNHFYPGVRTTKVYTLAQKLLSFLGNNWQ